MMERRAFVAGAVSVLAAPLAARAQQAAKVPRIGYLHPNLVASPHLTEAFRQGLRDLGYVEGGNVVIAYRDGEGKFDRLPALAAELVALPVDVIVASGTLAALAAKHATSSTPIVFPTVGDPVADGLVTSLARPDGNITGLSNLTPESVGKDLELLKEPFRESVRWLSSGKPSGFVERTRNDVRKRTDVAGRALGMRLRFVEAGGPEDFDRAFSDIAWARAGGVIVVTTALFSQQRRRLVELAAKFRVPAVYGSRDSVDVGG
jgi:putative tryptophan/tyrosine transport system substrate-binding protein